MLASSGAPGSSGVLEALGGDATDLLALGYKEVDENSRMVVIIQKIGNTHMPRDTGGNPRTGSLSLPQDHS